MSLLMSNTSVARLLPSNCPSTSLPPAPLDSSCPNTCMVSVGCKTLVLWMQTLVFAVLPLLQMNPC